MRRAQPWCASAGAQTVQPETFLPFAICLLPFDFPLTMPRYSILSQIGEKLYKARDTETDRLVALKFLPPGDPERKRRIQDAVAAVASVSHPNLARLFELVEAEEQDFLVTELVEGEPLDSILRRERLHRRLLFSFARQIAAALEAANACGVIHGGQRRRGARCATPHQSSRLRPRSSLGRARRRAAH